MKQLMCAKCGKIDKAMYDGYGVGDRLLEGVYFEVRYDVSGNLRVVRVTPSAADYFNGMNTSKWLREIQHDLDDNENDGTLADILRCPHNVDDYNHSIYCVDDVTGKTLWDEDTI